jgi:hypothetical protein
MENPASQKRSQIQKEQGTRQTRKVKPTNNTQAQANMKASHTNNPNRSAVNQRETHDAKPPHRKRTKKLYHGMRGSSMDLSRKGPDGWMGKPLVMEDGA